MCQGARSQRPYVSGVVADGCVPGAAIAWQASWDWDGTLDGTGRAAAGLRGDDDDDDDDAGSTAGQMAATAMRKVVLGRSLGCLAGLRLDDYGLVGAWQHGVQSTPPRS